VKIVKADSWYEDLVLDLRKIALEGIVRAKHAIGKRILLDFEKFGQPEYGERRIEGLAEDLQTNPREIYRCIQFAKKYPELEKCPGGTQLSWRKIKNELLPEIRTQKNKRKITVNEWVESLKKHIDMEYDKIEKMGSNTKFLALSLQIQSKIDLYLELWMDIWYIHDDVIKGKINLPIHVVEELKKTEWAKDKDLSDFLCRTVKDAVYETTGRIL